MTELERVMAILQGLQLTPEEAKMIRLKEDAIVFALLDKASKDLNAMEPKPLTLADLANLLGIVEK